jgi:hypothetical protein
VGLQHRLQTIERAFVISDRIQHIPSERQDDQYNKSKDELDRLLGDVLLLMKKEISLGA